MAISNKGRFNLDYNQDWKASDVEKCQYQDAFHLFYESRKRSYVEAKISDYIMWHKQKNIHFTPSDMSRTKRALDDEFDRMYRDKTKEEFKKYVGGLEIDPWDLPDNPEPKKEQPMSGIHPSAYIFLINDSVRAVKVKYEDPERPENKGKKIEEYVFKTFDKNIKVGDYVVVPTDTRWNMTVVRVSEVDVEPDLDRYQELKWIIGVVNQADFEQIKELEAKALELIKEKEKLKKKKELRETLALTDEDVQKLDINKVKTIDATPPSTTSN